jgi:polyisoprenyl-teichoic acid--peptidoglycan teichoic acid transferase
MRRKIKRVYLPKIRWYILVLLIVLTVGILMAIIGKATALMTRTDLSPGTVFRLIFNGGMSLRQTSGQTNILLLGIGGVDHEGADLTDTMIVLSLHTDKKSMSLLSLPRDIWSDTLQDKINSAYHYGEEKRKGGGLTLARVVVEDIIGIPIHYAIVADFTHFKSLIDQAGGIDVHVSSGFTDNQYPIKGKEDDVCDGDRLYRCRYMSVTFKTGMQHMDGERALIYVRSRHAAGTEGTDFARGKRQQEVLVALKDKLSRFSELINIRQDLAVLTALDKATDTDLSIGELLTVAKRASMVKADRTRRVSIEHLFTQPPQDAYGGRYVLIPQDSYSAVSQYVSASLAI